MKTSSKILGMTAALLALGLDLTAHAALFTTSGGGVYTAGATLVPGTVLPDNSASGVAYGIDFNATGLQISDIQVSFTISGGWNGDLYAYLSHGSTYSVLLNRVGTVNLNDEGYSASGFNVVLQPVNTHPGLNDIHTVPTPASAGAYAADGRISYTDTSRPQTLDTFLNTDPHGSWTLLFADRAGINTSTLNSWSLEITAVPEPVNVALGVFAALGVAGGVWKKSKKRKVKS